MASFMSGGMAANVAPCSSIDMAFTAAKRALADLMAVNSEERSLWQVGRIR